MDWVTVRFVSSSELRFRILTELLGRPVTPSEIASTLQKHTSQVSRALRELEAQDLVVAQKLEKVRVKPYVITPNGVQVLREIRLLTMRV